MIQFSVAIVPRGKGRPRATVLGGFARMYTDELTRKYEATISKAAMVVMTGSLPLEGPLSVVAQFRIPIPPSFSKRRRAAILAGTDHYAGAFDTDNLLKAVLDACNSICWQDDRQVMRLTAIKTPAERAGVDIRIEKL